MMMRFISLSLCDDDKMSSLLRVSFDDVASRNEGRVLPRQRSVHKRSKKRLLAE